MTSTTGCAFVGLDLGTTTLVAARSDADGNVTVLPNAHGSLSAPTTIGSADGTTLLAGFPAQALLAQGGAIDGMKYMLGMTSLNNQGHISEEVQTILNKISLTDVASCAMESRTHCQGEFPTCTLRKFPELKILPQDATASLIKYVFLPILRLAGITRFTHATVKIVLTVPAYFKHAARASLLQGVDMSGIARDCIFCVISEPAAALFSHLHHGLLSRRILKDGERVCRLYLVSDLGGGTYDATVLMVNQTGTATGKDIVSVEVIGLAGHNSRGGTDVTILVEVWMQETFVNAGLPEDALTGAELRERAEALKMDLSIHKQDVTLEVGGASLLFKYEEYVFWTRRFRAQVCEVGLAALQEARKSVYGKRLDTLKLTLMMVGGAHQDSLLMEEMTAALQLQFPGPRMHVAPQKDPLGFITSVARGAAIFSAFLNHSSARYQFVFHDQVPRDVRVHTKPDKEFPGTSRVIVPRGSQLDHWHSCPIVFKSAFVRSIGPGCPTLLSLVYAEGEEEDFRRNNRIGKGMVPYEAVKWVIQPGQTSLPAEALGFIMKSRVSSRGTLDIRVEVRDNRNELQLLTTIPVQFNTGGCLPPELLKPLIAAGVQEVVSLNYCAAKAAVDAALADLHAEDLSLSCFYSYEMRQAVEARNSERLWEVVTEIKRVSAAEKIRLEKLCAVDTQELYAGLDLDQKKEGEGAEEEEEDKGLSEAKRPRIE